MKTSTRNISHLISRYLGLWWFMGSMDTGRDWRFEVRVLCRNCPLCLKAFFQGFWLGKCGCIALFEDTGCVATCTNTQTPGGQKHFPPFSTISFLGAALLRARASPRGRAFTNSWVAPYWLARKSGEWTGGTGGYLPDFRVSLLASHRKNNVITGSFSPN